MVDSIEIFYKKNIEKLYGKPRSSKYDDDLLIENHSYDDHYYIDKRIDLSHLNVYSIDPPNCEDVDDAFSYFEDNDKKYVIIHIADPTHFISKDSMLFSDIVERAFTRYPSNRKPIHMMPKLIMEKSSLHENKYGSLKNAISIFIEYDENNEVDFKNIYIEFTVIKTQIKHKLAYTDDLEYYTEVMKCLELSEHLFPDVFYNHDKTMEVVYDDKKKPIFHNITDQEIRAKKMIAKFAILSNNYVGYLLKNYFSPEHIIFRNCNFENHFAMKSMTNFKEFIEYIVENSISANYDNKKSNHDLLKVDEYLHMTSPLRRSNDCIIHYLLKHSYLKYEGSPFSENEIVKMIEHSNIVNKKLKKIQFRDSKFRILHCMQESLNGGQKYSYEIDFYIFSFFYPYVNVIIHKMDNIDVYVSYTLKRDNIHLINSNLLNRSIHCKITKVNCCNYYDEGCLPELDKKLNTILHEHIQTL